MAKKQPPLPTPEAILEWIGQQSGIRVQMQETGLWRVDGDDSFGEARDLREAFAKAMTFVQPVT